jgi:hypothetical protein
VTAFRPLLDELDRWAAAGRTATLWWRDDDACEMTESLSRLLAVRDALGVPLGLAVIPAKAQASLASGLPASADIALLQHGYAHRNHSPDLRRKSELGADRPVWDAVAELMAGRERLARVVGDRPLPILVPPWNRIDAGLVALLPGLGYTGLSTFAPRTQREAASGVTIVNTHIDVIDWLGSRKFVGEAAAVAAATAHLASRRTGAVDAGEPTGLLTHHLVHDAATWSFLERFLAATAGHRAARWLPVAEAFAP